MLRDDRADPGRRWFAARNVLGEPLDICLIKPTTGFYRDGCCNTGQEDIGSHTVCAVARRIRGRPSAARGFARHSRRRLGLLLARRSQTVRSGPGVTSIQSFAGGARVRLG